MTTIEIKEKLHHYIDTAQNKKIKAIYTLVEDEIKSWEGEKLSKSKKGLASNISKRNAIK